MTYKTRKEIHEELKREHGSGEILSVIRDWRTRNESRGRLGSLGDFYVAHGACPECKGLGVVYSIPSMPTISVPGMPAERCVCKASLEPINPGALSQERETRLGLDIDEWKALADRQRDRIFELDMALAKFSQEYERLVSKIRGDK